MARDRSGEPTLVQRRILLLLAAGFTVQTITKLVFLSERAVHDHIANLKQATGAKNQFSLGAEAAKRGWLEDEDEQPGRR
ncbi:MULTISPECIES: LuxR C-terminal-related transcriptional regulator [Catellatospora]|uniref:LuxR C-terminal-related transcriptional regulator n=1 Tax=Catellatospora TaxID=53365 RepID=UPI0011821739|nr:MULTISPECIES: LuxR C-terminal-related transcriptional regulator [Catellatospora]